MNINTKQTVHALTTLQLQSIIDAAIKDALKEYPGFELELAMEKLRLFTIGKDNFEQIVNSGKEVLSSIVKFTDVESYYRQVFFYYLCAHLFELKHKHSYNAFLGCYELMLKDKEAKVYINKSFGFKMLGLVC